jgi:tRNA threonylcarbamoyl adenosine modification protein (Sua5/YciO/YrdC/YwlC family)
MVSDLAACGKRLRKGGLVAFPTETVYGLGCHALDEGAVLKVFAAKERPLSDPLIVHVLHPDEAFALWNLAEGSVHRRILSELCRAFWPGPLTLVAPAKSGLVPACVTAGTGFVACRSPAHGVARDLLEQAGVPLGAPSANKFGHVSPTTAQHVWDDLRREDVWIVPDRASALPGGGGCDVGVESTVAKVEQCDSDSEDGQARVQILRQGKVSAQDVRECLRKANLPALVEEVQRSTAEHAVNVAPGQTLRHYSPNVPSFLIAPSAVQPAGSILEPRQREALRRAVVIDFGGRLSRWKDDANAYRDLSPGGSATAAAKVVFETLRWAEQQPHASLILFPQLLRGDNNGVDDQHDSLLLAVKDRLTRAASGVILSSLDDL